MPTTTRRTRKTAATAPAATTDEPRPRPRTRPPPRRPTRPRTRPPTRPRPRPRPTAAPTTDPAPAATADATTATDTETIDSDTPADAPVSGAPVSGAPVSGAPVGSGDHLKVVMVAGILGDHPDGVTAAAHRGRVRTARGHRRPGTGRDGDRRCGRAQARHRHADDDDPDASDASGVELWLRGEADLTTVDLSAAAVRVVCPTCHRPMPRRNTVNVTRTGPAAPGQNSDGSRTLGKNELRNIVRDFLAAHPGHEFTPTTISREIGRSSGAIGNALAKLVVSGEAVLVKEAPATFTAPETAADPAAETDPATTGK